MGKPGILTLLAATALAARPAGAQVVTAPAVPRGWIGISVDVPVIPMAPWNQGFALITEVSEGSPAEAAGIRVGDRLISINGHGWEEGFGRSTGTIRPDEQVRLVVGRDDERRTFVVRAARRPAELSAVPFVTLTVRADTIVERLYRGMDSLRLRLVGEGGAGVHVLGIPRRTDSLRTIVGITGATAATGGRQGEERTGAAGGGFSRFVIPEISPPFGFLALSGDLPDSLLREMEALNREIVGLRARESSRMRALAADRRSIDQEDPQLARVRRALEDASRRSRELRSTMERVARQQTSEGTGVSLTWSVGPDSAVAAYTLRPLAPYVLGQNRAAGAEVVDLRPELAEYFDVDGGVLLVDVPSGTPAAEAGLQPGDVITHVDDLPVPSIRALRAGLARGGVDLTVTLVRKGRRLEVLLHRD